MVSVIVLGIWVCVILFRIYDYMFKRPPNFPPGPPRVPFFGSYLFLLMVNYRHIHRATERLSKYYKNKLVGFYYGDFKGIAVHDIDTIKEVMMNPDMDGRPLFMLARTRDPKFDIWGIFFKDGLFWRDQRRFTLRHLRDFGFGRRFDELESNMNEEMLSFVNLVKNGPKYAFEEAYIKNGIVKCPQIFSANPANLFLQVFTNDRLNREQCEKLFRAGDAAFGFQRNADMYGRIFSLVESTMYLFPTLSGYKPVRKHAMDLYDIIKEIIEEQYKTYNVEHQRHFLDLYFKEMKNGVDASYNMDQLVHTIVDFIFPALSAISTTITFALQRLILNPEIMAKCQKEIDDVVGKGRLPTIDDRIELSYTEATLRESMRLDTLVANGVPHLALNDTKVGGYDLPKGGFVVTVLQAAHEDEAKYKDALTFKPERFLDRRGRLNLKLDTTLPFGAGKRLCAGETFARNILYLYLATILQNFKISVPEGTVMPHPALELQTTGTVKTPPDFWLKFESR